MSTRGVDVDALCISPPIDGEAFATVASEILAESGYERLASINDVRLDTLMEWCVPGERCIAMTTPYAFTSSWQIVYDSQFNHAEFAEGLSKSFTDHLFVQYNLQEEVDFTLRVLFKGAALYEFSNAPSFFNWGRCIGKNEPANLARVDIPALAEALGRPLNPDIARTCFNTITAKTLGERKSSKGKHSGGVYDAIQTLATEMRLPRLYRFFEGWMKSDLDWDEDNIEQVWAFRKK